MASQVEISIPNAQPSTASKTYTLYNISLRLPGGLRSFTTQKRYSDFVSLNSALTSQAGSTPLATLPAKSWFTRTTSSPELTEERRKGLEAYLQTINKANDERWRNSSAWRTFLNLPSNNNSRSTAASNLHKAIAGGAPITDPVIWLDHHRDLKSQLHDARLALTRRDQASAAQAQHEASAQAKKFLVRAGTMLTALETGLKNLSSGSIWGSSKLGEGELRRRRDLLSSAKREKEGLESLASAIVAKAAVDRAVASAESKTQLLGPADKPQMGGRILGKETERTRALDNQGVVQLQKQMMQEQDEDVMVLAQAVSKQKDLGIAIAAELEEQDKLLDMLDEDTTRVQGKMDVARKRVAKIS